jgi:hypothetical protein
LPLVKIRGSEKEVLSSSSWCFVTVFCDEHKVLLSSNSGALNVRLDEIKLLFAITSITGLRTRKFLSSGFEWVTFVWNSAFSCQMPIFMSGCLICLTDEKYTQETKNLPVHCCLSYRRHIVVVNGAMIFVQTTRILGF